MPLKRGNSKKTVSFNIKTRNDRFKPSRFEEEGNHAGSGHFAREGG